MSPADSIAERCCRDSLASAWHRYREARHLPMTREYARREIQLLIVEIRAIRALQGLTTHRLPSWWGCMTTEDEAA